MSPPNISIYTNIGCILGRHHAQCVCDTCAKSVFEMFSEDLRWRVIYLKLESAYSNRRIAIVLKMHKSTVKRIVHRWLLSGDVSCRKVGRPCVPRMHLHEQFVVIEAILANPSLTQEEIQWEIRNTTGASYELSTVWRNLKRLGISQKQVCIQIIF